VSEEQGNAAAWFVDQHISEGRAGKVAYREKSREITYGEIAASSDKMADLYARAGIRREDRAALIMLDVIEYPVIFWGSLKAGVVPIPLNTMLTAEQHAYILKDSRARVLFISEPLLEGLLPVLQTLPDLQAVFVVGEDDSLPNHFGTALKDCIAQPMVNTGGDEVAFWLYSSGSTGMPKGVKHVHSALRETCDTYGTQVLGIKESDVCYSAAKFFFAYGLGNALSFPMSVGATVAILPDRPTPDAVFEVLERELPTIFFGVPTLYGAMLAAAGDGPIPGAENLRQSVSAGEALPREIGERWKEKTGTDILDGVGSTEMLHIFLSNAPGGVVYGTSGKAVPGYEMRLVDEAGGDVSVGDIGELVVNGKSAADGYWNKRDKSRATFEGNWTRTGDKYTCDAEGRYTYCGRTDDMFKVSGIWVSPFEVEQALIGHNAVLEAAIVPALDAEGLEKPKAFVVLNQGVEGDLTKELQDHVKDVVGKWKYPRWVEFCDELPKTATGKIQRFKLRED